MKKSMCFSIVLLALFMKDGFGKTTHYQFGLGFNPLAILEAYTFSMQFQYKHHINKNMNIGTYMLYSSEEFEHGDYYRNDKYYFIHGERFILYNLYKIENLNGGIINFSGTKWAMKKLAAGITFGYNTSIEKKLVFNANLGAGIVHFDYRAVSSDYLVVIPIDTTKEHGRWVVPSYSRGLSLTTYSSVGINYHHPNNLSVGLSGAVLYDFIDGGGVISISVMMGYTFKNQSK